MRKKKIDILNHKIDRLSRTFTYNEPYSLSPQQIDQLNHAGDLIQEIYAGNTSARWHTFYTLVGLGATLAIQWADHDIGIRLGIIAYPALFLYYLGVLNKINLNHKKYAQARDIYNQIHVDILTKNDMKII